jgi:hypothetical protein
MRSWIWRSSWVVLMGVIEPRAGADARAAPPRERGRGGGRARRVRGSSDGPAGALCPEVPSLALVRAPARFRSFPLESARFRFRKRHAKPA